MTKCKFVWKFSDGPLPIQKKSWRYPWLQLPLPTLSHLVGDSVLQLRVFLNEERDRSWSQLHKLDWGFTNPWVRSGCLSDSCQEDQQWAVVCHFCPTGCHQTVPTGAQTLDHTCKPCKQQWAYITGLKFLWFVIFSMVGVTGQVQTLFLYEHVP
jgi:hypothetical protein